MKVSRIIFFPITALFSYFAFLIRNFAELFSRDYSAREKAWPAAGVLLCVGIPVLIVLLGRAAWDRTVPPRVDLVISNGLTKTSVSKDVWWYLIGVDATNRWKPRWVAAGEPPPADLPDALDWRVRLKLRPVVLPSAMFPLTSTPTDINTESRMAFFEPAVDTLIIDGRRVGAVGASDSARADHYVQLLSDAAKRSREIRVLAEGSAEAWTPVGSGFSVEQAFRGGQGVRRIEIKTK